MKARVKYINNQLKINKSVEIETQPIDGKIGENWELGRFYETRRHGILSGCAGSIPTMNLQGKTALDVGANIGNHSLFFSVVMGADVISIEPHPAAFGRLFELTAGIKGIDQINKAAGAKKAKAKISDKGWVSTVGDEGFDCDVITVDSLKLKECALIKIDTEGYELDVLKGAKKTIEACKPVIFAELQTKAEFQAASEYLATLGYKAYVCQGCGARGRNPFVFNATPTYRFDPV